MPQLRCRLDSAEVTPLYHIVSRWVWRHLLCETQPLTGKDHSDGKRTIQERSAYMAEAFVIDVCACAILSNHRRQLVVYF